MARDSDMHVLVFTDTFFETNGVGSYYRTLLDWCRQEGKVRVSILCPLRDDLPMDEAGPEVIPVRPSINFLNPFYRDLTIGYYSRVLLRRIVNGLPGSKVVHIATSGPLGFAGAGVARRLQLPCVGCYHTDMNYYGRLYGKSVFGRPGAWLGERVTVVCDRLAYGRCDAMCVPTLTAEKSVSKFYRGPTRVVPNPIDVQRFRPAPSRSGAFRERYTGEGRVLVVAVGRVAREKNLDLIAELLSRDPRIDLVFVGDGPYAAELQARWGVRVTGFLYGESLLAAYQQADLFVQLSLSETFGLALVEALACGLPAVVLRAPGFASNLAAGRGVEILEREDLPALADRCVSLVRDADGHRERSRLVRKLVLSLSAEAVLPEFIEFHRSFVHDPTPRFSPAKLLAVEQPVGAP